MTKEFIINYLDKSGFFFACSDEIDKTAMELVKEGVFQPVENLGVGYPSGNKSYFYVRAILKTKYELPVSMWMHFVEGVPS